MQNFTIVDSYGRRKYLTVEERKRFFEAVPKVLKREQRPFALLLYWTGCRITEGLNVTVGGVDYSQQSVQFKTLKRRKDVYRSVPLPPTFLEKLDDVYDLKARQKARSEKELRERIWPFDRKTGSRYIKRVMAEAGIEGIQACPKGLRHSFVIAHQEMKTPGHMIQRWAGWSTPAMMEVYAAAVGQEERNIAAALWNM